jgi:hypothetical protein
LPEAAAIVGQIVQKDVTYRQIPLEAVRSMSADYAAMLDWFERVGYSADVPALERDWGIRPRTLKEWARR